MTRDPQRASVFISYSRTDAFWLERLRTHLHPLEQTLILDVWDDRMIRPGQKWKTEIEKAILSARVAVLLVSPDFLASDFISHNELPELLRRAESGGATILPLILSPCRFSRDQRLSGFQAVNSPDEPLVGLSPARQDEVLDRLATHIERLVAKPVLLTSSSLIDRNTEDPDSGLSAVHQQIKNDFLSTHNIESIQALDQAVSTYYRCLAEESRLLPLGTIAAEYISRRDADRISLASIYVRLDVQSAARDDLEEDARSWSLRLTIGDERYRVPLLEAITSSSAQNHVLLGEAGSGKTSLINYLTFLLATGDPSLPESFAGLVPLHLVLREVAAKHIHTASHLRGTATIFWNALEADISHHLGSQVASQLMPHLQKKMIREGALVLLDGLDEVPEADQRRRVLLEAVSDLATVLGHPRTRFLVTARPYAYADPHWQLRDFTSWSISPFSELQAHEFIRLWYKALRPSFGWSEDTAETKGATLQNALREKSYLGELAGRPLFLTLMAALHSNRGQLPEDRAELYEETVQLMLSRWQRAREVRGPDGTMIVEPGITEALDVAEGRIRPFLERLAYTVHKRQRQRPHHLDGPADISRGEILEAFEFLLDSVRLQTLLRYLEDRAGLLVERKGGVFAFPHRSFQEYLAACACAEEPDFPENLVEHVREDTVWWREIFLLAVGKARRASLTHAVSIVTTLLPEGPEPHSERSDAEWQHSILAGEAIRELRLPERARGKKHLEVLVKNSTRWLKELILQERLSPKERLHSGDILGSLGDERSGVGCLIVNNRLLPDIEWLNVPAGEFWMGSSPTDPGHQPIEAPRHQVFLPAFAISRYPVTNIQFKAFIDAGGYRDRRYWNTAGWNWVTGGDADFAVIYDEHLRSRYRKWMSRRPLRKEVPDWWGDSDWAPLTRPVVGVNWFEAMAYAKWLSGLYSDGALELNGLLAAAFSPANLRVILPTEAQWEKAARGADGRSWPWGEAAGTGHANTKEEDLRRTSPVGVFPSGASPSGALDMIGNVWEWTLSRWGRNGHLSPDYLYPYDPSDGRDDETGSYIRVVRGSSWFGDREIFGRCSYRGWGFAFNSSNFSGFRLALRSGLH